MSSETTSSRPEFNNGFITALALFYAHRFRDSIPELDWDRRVYAGSDHLLDIEIPENLKPELRDEIKKFVDDVLSRRNDDTCKGLVAERLFDRCLNILVSLDRELFGLDVIVVYP
jgi:hypothetical protein